MLAFECSTTLFTALEIGRVDITNNVGAYCLSSRHSDRGVIGKPHTDEAINE